MRFFKGHFLSIFVLSIAALSTSSLATDVICVDESDPTAVKTLEDEDGVCKYYRIEDGRRVELYVVPDGEDPRNKAAAIRNANFYVFAPQAQKLDSVVLVLKSDDSKVTNLMPVKSDADKGVVAMGINSHYKLYNLNLGTADDELATNPRVSLVYNYYVPYLKYFVEGKEVTNLSKLQYEVGDTMYVDVEAYVPVGPLQDQVDTGLIKTFYIEAFGDSKNLIFLSEGGVVLKQVDNTIRLDVKEGVAKFKVVTPKAITDGSSFSLNAYKNPTDSTKFILTEPFPGITETLRELRARGMKTAVLSNKFDAAVRELSDHYFPGLFDVSLGEIPPTPRKPDPTMLLQILDEFGVKPEEAVYVGDTSVDVEVARNAGTKAVGVSWGYDAALPLPLDELDAYIHEASELLKLVD